MRRIFSPGSPYKKRARFLAILWTLLIFIGCLTPSKDIPEVDVPLIDKWTHVVMFGGFSFLWMCARPLFKSSWYVMLFLISVVLGAFIEMMQGALPSLGRSMEAMDIAADSIGGAVGILIFILLSKTSGPKEQL
jgi:VanZ family protein